MNQEEIRTVFTSVKDNQVLYLGYGPKWSGCCEVKQITKRPGRNGETFLIVRFLGSSKFFKLGWRNPNIRDVQILALEDYHQFCQ
jgi:hypothetical protein